MDLSPTGVCVRVLANLVRIAGDRRFACCFASKTIVGAWYRTSHLSPKWCRTRLLVASGGSSLGGSWSLTTAAIPVFDGDVEAGAGCLSYASIASCQSEQHLCDDLMRIEELFCSWDWGKEIAKYLITA